MAQNDPLFNLIKSLSKAEKRYFKLQSKQHQIGEANNYVRLFDVLEKQKVYDKAVLEKVFRKEKFMKHLSAAKRYLFQQILESLAEFHESKNEDLMLRREIRYVELLMNKKQLKSGRKLLNRLLKKAKTSKNYLRLFELQQLERQFIANTDISSEEMWQCLEREEEIEATLKSLTRIERVRWIYYRFLVLLNRKSRVVGEEEKTYYKQLIQDPIFQEAATSDSTYLRELCDDTMLRYYYMIEPNHTKSYEIAKRSFQFSQHEYSESKSYPLRKLLTKAQRLIYRAILCRQYKDILPVLKYINQLPLSNQYEQTLFCEVYFAGLFLYRIKTGDTKQVNSDLAFFADQIDLLAGKMNIGFELNLYTIVAHLYFMLGDYPQALHYLDLFLQHPKAKTLEKIIGPAYIFRIIILYEQEAFDAFEKYKRNTFRKLKQLTDYPQFYTLFQYFFTKIWNTSTLKEEQQQYKLLFEKLEILYNQNIEKPAFGIFDFTNWAEAKIKNVSYLKYKKAHTSLSMD